MTLDAVVYVSSAVRLLDGPDLEALLVDARAFNEKSDVTGALLYDDGAFFQYFEGPEPEVAEVYERIKRSRLHKGLIELFHRPVEQRQFGSGTWASAGSPGPICCNGRIPSGQTRLPA